MDDTPAGPSPSDLSHDDGYFPEEVAAVYDQSTDAEFRPEVVRRTVDVLERLADGGRALEFAVGTGRVAVPLAERGVEVAGIEMSRAMLRRLRAKPGGDRVEVTEGDMATARVPGRFSLAYLVFNTLNNLTTQDAQVECFVNAARHLAPGGRFLVEVGVPDLRLLPPGQTVVPFASTPGYWGFDEYDTVTQAMWSHHLRSGEGRASHRSIPFRYVWPSELDLMARIAGMRRVERWAGWDGEPFTADSRKHVSVWEKAPA
ncbi:class I SAM-dependent methyltransferase [Streptomyces sp. NPDC005438]|uniref:class I SAM-dependent DNA methyltransferase n=1 Tax=Streptomyces sp. NPDC005438 TaxID=3156880 RepID=UPI0033B29CAF